MRSGKSHANGDTASTESDGDANSDTNDDTTLAITIPDNIRDANPHPYLYASSSNSATSAFAATSPLACIYEKETHCSIRLV